MTDMQDLYVDDLTIQMCKNSVCVCEMLGKIQKECETTRDNAKVAFNYIKEYQIEENSVLYKRANALHVIESEGHKSIKELNPDDRNRLLLKIYDILNTEEN